LPRLRVKCILGSLSPTTTFIRFSHWNNWFTSKTFNFHSGVRLLKIVSWISGSIPTKYISKGARKCHETELIKISNIFVPGKKINFIILSFENRVIDRLLKRYYWTSILTIYSILWQNNNNFQFTCYLIFFFLNRKIYFYLKFVPYFLNLINFLQRQKVRSIKSPFLTSLTWAFIYAYIVQVKKYIKWCHPLRKMVARRSKTSKEERKRAIKIRDGESDKCNNPLC